MRLKKDITISPLMIGIIASLIFYLILAFFNLFNSISMIGIFIFIYLFSSSIATIIFYVSYRNVGLVEKGVNILYSIVLIMFTSNTVSFVTSSSTYFQNAVNELLAFTLIILGLLYAILTFINRGFPKWYRKFSIIIGVIMLGASGICFLLPSISNILLIIFLCICKIATNYVKESV